MEAGYTGSPQKSGQALHGEGGWGTVLNPRNREARGLVVFHETTRVYFSVMSPGGSTSPPKGQV